MLKKFFCPPCLVGLILILAVFGGYFLLKRGYQAPAPVTPEVTEEKVVPLSTSEVKEVTVVGTEFAFSPSTITVEAGQEVRITFENRGGAPHNLVLEDLGIATKTISGGQTDVVEFIAPSTGTYSFFCSIPGHRPAGMEGALKIE